MELTLDWGIPLQLHPEATHVVKVKTSPYPFTFSKPLAMVVPFETKEDPYPGDRNRHFPIRPTAH
jgi:hypothetical protein